MKLKNTDFGHYIAPLMRPVYVMQMARSKEWSPRARLQATLRLRDACLEVIDSIDRVLPRMRDEYEWDRAKS